MLPRFKTLQCAKILWDNIIDLFEVFWIPKFKYRSFLFFSIQIWPVFHFLAKKRLITWTEMYWKNEWKCWTVTCKYCYTRRLSLIRRCTICWQPFCNPCSTKLAPEVHWPKRYTITLRQYLLLFVQSSVYHCFFFLNSSLTVWLWTLWK